MITCEYNAHYGIYDLWNKELGRGYKYYKNGTLPPSINVRLSRNSYDGLVWKELSLDKVPPEALQKAHERWFPPEFNYWYDKEFLDIASKMDIYHNTHRHIGHYEVKEGVKKTDKQDYYGFVLYSYTLMVYTPNLDTHEIKCNTTNLNEDLGKVCEPFNTRTKELILERNLSRLKYISNPLLCNGMCLVSLQGNNKQPWSVKVISQDVANTLCMEEITH